MTPLEKLRKELPFRRDGGAGVAIGNGPSRRGFDLWRLRGVTTIGSNALYRDGYIPNFFTVVDPDMAREMDDAGVVHSCSGIISDRERRGFTVISSGTRQGISQSSGVLGAACLMAMGVDVVFLLGHDLVGTTLYQGSKCYKGAGPQEKDFKQWWKDLTILADEWSGTLIQVGGRVIPGAEWIKQETFERMYPCRQK